MKELQLDITYKVTSDSQNLSSTRGFTNQERAFLHAAEMLQRDEVREVRILVTMRKTVIKSD